MDESETESSSSRTKRHRHTEVLRSEVGTLGLNDKDGTCSLEIIKKKKHLILDTIPVRFLYSDV